MVAPESVESRDDREDRREGHGGDEAVEQVAAHRLRQFHGDHVRAAEQVAREVEVAVGAGLEELGMLREQRDRREADDEGQQIEVADETRRDEHGLARLLRVGHGEEAHQDMREARRAEHQRDAERERVERILQQLARSHDAERAGMNVHGAAKHLLRTEAELRERGDRHEGRAAQQQHGLDDLHPGGRGHAAEEHVDHHQRADDDFRHPVLQAEQQLDQLARADHLHDQIEDHDDERRAGRQQADRRLLEAVGDHIDERELAEIAQGFGEQEHHERPADQKADRIDQAVEAEHEHHAGETQERCRGHVVPGDGEPVLKAGDAAARAVEVLGRAGPARCPARDAERDEHEQQEHADRDGIQFDMIRHRAFDGGSVSERGHRGEARARQEGERVSSISLLAGRWRAARSSSGSSVRFARSTYQPVRPTAIRMMPTPATMPMLVVAPAYSGRASTCGASATNRMKP